MTRVSRGVFGATASAARQMAPSDPSEAASRAYAKHLGDPTNASLWKDRREWAQMLARGQADLYGRRLFSPLALSKARYIARLSFHARHGQPPVDKQWGYLRTALLTVYQELGVRR